MVIDKNWQSFMVGFTISMCLGVALSSPIRAEEAPHEEEPGPVRILHDANGRTILTLSSETQTRIGLAVQRVQPTTLQPEVAAYGRLEQDPGQVFTLRAPISGFLRDAPDHSWPGLGASLESATIVGQVEPRVTPLELLDLRSRWMDSQAEVDEINAELDAARASLEHKSRLNVQSRLVADRVVEEARARLEGGEARLQAARQKVDMLGQLLTGSASAPAPFPLKVVSGGEVVDVLARPGEVVEPGQALLTVARYDTLIVRVALPLGQHADLPLPPSRIVLQGDEGAVLTAQPIGEASKNDPLTNGQTLLYRISSSNVQPFRPGTAATAFIPVSGKTLTGVTIPRSAVLRYGGKTWAYIKTDEDHFERRDIPLHTPTKDGWFVVGGVVADEAVVVASAQLLLSEELKAEIESEEEAAE